MSEKNQTDGFYNGEMQWISYAAIIEACSGSPFTANRLPHDESEAIIAAVNQGIDSHLEACFIPDRGDVYEVVSNGPSRYCGYERRMRISISPESLCVLLRRLFEADPCSSFASSVLTVLGFNESARRM